MTGDGSEISLNSWKRLYRRAGPQEKQDLKEALQTTLPEVAAKLFPRKEGSSKAVQAASASFFQTVSLIH